MIPNLKQDGIAEFQGKKITVNLAESEAGTLLSAKNVMVLSDSQLRRAPGYTLVTQIGPGPINAVWDFQRDVDNTQFVFVQSGAQIWVMNADGTSPRQLTSGETGTHQFVSNSFIAYSSDGTNAWRYVDVGGVLTKYKWGITAPITAPAISKSAGTLTLTYGRRYVYCYVSKYTDSLGIQRVSISAPSPLSVHTGPVASQVVTLSAMARSTDAQVNYIWIFATSDSPSDTSATYYFAAEITNGTTSWGDTLMDSALDQTRLAPFDNNPAPPAPILGSFQNRIVTGNGSLIQLSGYSEITLGIPEEAWPTSLFFNVPSGKRTISAIMSLKQGTILAIGTQDYWYAYTGYDASTFTEQDRVASPGPAGSRALTMTPIGLMFLGANQSLRVWTGSEGEAASISDDQAKKLTGTYAMDDIDPAHIASSQLVWYDYGPVDMLVGFVRTSDYQGNGFNWMQLWSFANQTRETSGQYGSGSGLYAQMTGVYQTDKLPTDGITAAGSVDVGFAGVDYVYMGDTAGNVYRWPDGFLDNANPYIGIAQLAWHLPNEGNSRYYWVDILTDRQDAKDAFQVYAVTSDAPDQGLIPKQLSLQNIPSPKGQSGQTIRASLNADGVATGKYISVSIQFPQDNQDAVIRKIVLASRPINAGIA
jgi:hypothetical protein